MPQRALARFGAWAASAASSATTLGVTAVCAWEIERAPWRLDSLGLDPVYLLQLLAVGLGLGAGLPLLCVALCRQDRPQLSLLASASAFAVCWLAYDLCTEPLLPIHGCLLL